MAASAWVRSLNLTFLWSRLKAETKDLAVSLLKPEQLPSWSLHAWGTVLGVSCRGERGEGGIPIRLVQASLLQLQSFFHLSPGASCWLKGWLQGFPMEQLGAAEWENPICSSRKAKQCHKLEEAGLRSGPPPHSPEAGHWLVPALPLYRQPTGTIAWRAL